MNKAQLKVRNMKTLCQVIASKINTMQNCVKSSNDEWYRKHKEVVEELVKEYFPHGSGIDGSHGEFDYEKSTDKKLVFYSSYHYMDENGFYDGWYDFTIYFEASLMSIFNTRATVPKRLRRRDYDEYLRDVYHDAMNQEIEEYTANKLA